MPRVYWQFLTVQYKPGPKAWNYFRRLARAQRARQFAEADLNLYPAHLHINVDAAYRGHGIGLRLMQSFLDQLIYERIPGVHLGTSSENEGACRLYTQLGFQLLDARITSLWEDIIDHPVENRTYGLLLPDPRSKFSKTQKCLKGSQRRSKSKPYQGLRPATTQLKGSSSSDDTSFCFSLR